MSLDTNGDFVISKTVGGNTFSFCLQGDNSAIVYGGITYNLGIASGQSCTVNKSAGIMIFPMPMQDSNHTLAFDVSGVKREFNFNGTVTANDMECITRFIQTMNGLINGNQMVDGGSTNLTIDYKLNRIFENGNFYKASGTVYNTGSTFVSQIPVNPIRIIVTNFSYTYNAAQDNQLQYSLQFTEGDPTNDENPIGNQFIPWGE